MWAGFNWRSLLTTTIKCAVVKIVGNSLTVELVSASQELRSVVKEEVRRDSSVSVVTTLRAGRLKGPSTNPSMAEAFSSPLHSACCSVGTVAKRPGREADHSPPSSAQAMNNWI